MSPLDIIIYSQKDFRRDYAACMKAVLNGSGYFTLFSLSFEMTTLEAKSSIILQIGKSHPADSFSMDSRPYECLGKSEYTGFLPYE